MVDINVAGISLGGSKGLGMAKRTQKWTQQNIRLGNSLDMANQKEMFDYRINAGLEAGMTPYEMFMGPAAGAGGGTTGSGAVLGNSASQLGKQMMQTKAQNVQFNKQIAADLTKTKMQTDAQKEVAKIQAGTQLDVAEINNQTQKLIAENRLKFDQKTYREITLPEAAARINKTVAETKKAINEIATTEKKFVERMTFLKMGVDNVLATAISDKLGYDISDPKALQKMPLKKREELISTLLAIQSGTGKNIEGLKEQGDKLLNWLFGEIEKPPAVQVKPNLGNTTSRGGGW
jgi:hypothetical protein